MTSEGDRFNPNNLVLVQPCHGREEIVSFAVHRENVVAIVIAKIPLEGHHPGHKARVLKTEPGKEASSQNSLGWFDESKVLDMFQNHIVQIYPKPASVTCADCFADFDNSESPRPIV